ncbi:MAG TPA: hypothetical protein VGP47_02220 [Parachlamydiaceae bacterium]|nr:hypothetical protein [Parachlamydiaceae bacterium]
MNFSTIVDEGRVHVASGAQYQGSINSYNNFVTRFSKYFGFSSDVIIDGKTHCLNNKSYVHFLHTLGLKNVSVDGLWKYKNLDTPYPIGQRITLLTNKGPMRTHLTTKKTNELGRELINAIRCFDVNKSQKLLSQGANPNQAFWIRDYDGISFNAQFKNDLPNRRIEPFRATHLSPLLLAALNCQDVLVEDLQRYGANVNFKGERFTFSRDIVDVNTQFNLQTAMHLDVVPSRPFQRRDVFGQPIGYANRSAHLENRLGVDGVNHQTITFEDRHTDHQSFTLDTTNNRLKFTDQPENNQTYQFKITSEVGRARIF